MKQLLLICAVGVLVGCGTTLDPELELGIRRDILKREGDLTAEDLAKVDGLSMHGWKVTDATAQGASKFQNITSLSMSSPVITDAGLKDMAKLQKLEGLFLNRTQVTKAGVAEFKKVLPNCKITGP